MAMGVEHETRFLIVMFAYAGGFDHVTETW